MAPLLIIDYGTKAVDLIPEDVLSHVYIIPNLLGHTHLKQSSLLEYWNGRMSSASKAKPPSSS